MLHRDQLKRYARDSLNEIYETSGKAFDTRILFEVLSRLENKTFNTQDLLSQLSKDLSILLVSADPLDAEALDLDGEQRALLHALYDTKYASNFTVRTANTCRPEGLIPVLDRYNPRILHFSGHGSEDGLCVEDSDGNARIVDPEALADLLSVYRPKGLELVVLNACYSTQQANAMAAAVGHVISMTGTVTDTAAIEFSKILYSGLGQGKSLVDAFKTAKFGAVFLTGWRNIDARLLPEDE